MGLLAKIRAYSKVLPRAKRNRMELVRIYTGRPALGMGVGAMETAELLSGRVDIRFKALASLKTSSRIGCPFWMDIGSAVSRAVGVTERQLLELSDYETSDAFDEGERLAIELAVAMLGEPVVITPDLRARLETRFTRTQLVELASYIAWEHYRSRFNRALDVQAVGFSDGAVCVLPEHRRD